MQNFVYFPYRAFKARPYCEEVARLPRDQQNMSVLTFLSIRRMKDVFGEERKGDPHVSACLSNEVSLARVMAEFSNAGQAIFHIEPKLRDAFINSDLGDASILDIDFPFPTIYVHLGASENLKFNDGLAYLEGVFLSKHVSGFLQVTLVGPLVTEAAHWGERGMESYTFDFWRESLNLPIMQSVEKHLNAELGIFEAEDGEDDLPSEEQTDVEEERESWISIRRERELHAANRGVLLDCLRMAFNALLYVSHYPEDLVEDYQDGFPAGFKQKIERSTGKVRERTVAKARAAGFTLIKRVGKSFEKDLETSGGDSPSPHLRRAHWRRQVYGPKGSLRKLVWIRATRVLGGSQRERPYLVQDNSNLPGEVTEIA